MALAVRRFVGRSSASVAFTATSAPALSFLAASSTYYSAIRCNTTSTGAAPPAAAAAAAAGTATTTLRKKSRGSVGRNQGNKKLTAPKPRVAVLVSSYEGSSAITAQYDEDVCTPAHWVGPDFPYRFTYHSITKKNAHSEIRKLAMDEKDPITCFFNLCDGAAEEDRAGVDVILAMQKFPIPFTGPMPECFEPHKVTMKLLAEKAGVKIPPFALVQKGQDIAFKCRHLRFPVFVKPPSGFASVGITKESKCHNAKELVKVAGALIKEIDVALVEEFISGREGTVLVCRDDSSKDGVRVFPPVVMNLPGGNEDFASFENKWVTDWARSAQNIPKAFDLNDPYYGQIVATARNAYKSILQGFGYGRVDFRIDEKHGTGVYFLEINPNCGMWYPPQMGGDWADIMVKYDKDWDHSTFARNQIEGAIRDFEKRKRWYRPTVDATKQFVTKATTRALSGDPVFGNKNDHVPVVLRTLYSEATKQTSCVAMRGDDRTVILALKHSCKPNLQLLHGQALELQARKLIRRGDILTLDYGTIRDPNMKPFECKCGAEFCRRVIRSVPPKPRKSPWRRSQKSSRINTNTTSGAVTKTSSQQQQAQQAPQQAPVVSTPPPRGGGGATSA